jgi:hypothetical protein
MSHTDYLLRLGLDYPYLVCILRTGSRSADGDEQTDGETDIRTAALLLLSSSPGSQVSNANFHVKHA